MSMRIVCISDTHLAHMRSPIPLPDGDVLIHAGDATFRGTNMEIMEFSSWFDAQPHTHKIFVAGNHDVGFEKNEASALAVFYGGIYLKDSGVEIDGIKFWGSPWQPEFYDWAFNLPRGKPLRDKWALIPEGTDVLVTHGPPQMILDKTPRGEAVGCRDLMDRVLTVKPRLHVFGHVHGSYGRTVFHDTTFVNASICNEAYQPANAAIVVDL